MNKYFKTAVDAYHEQFEEIDITAISEADAEIIVEIKEILLKTPQLQEIKDILDDWKCASDSDIRDVLMQWNIDHPHGGGKDEIPRTTSIVIKGKRIPAHDIFGFEPVDRMDYGTMKRKHLIILNPIPPEMKKMPMYSNTVVEFGSAQERDTYLEKLDTLRNHNLLDLDLLEE